MPAMASLFRQVILNSQIEFWWILMTYSSWICQPPGWFAMQAMVANAPPADDGEPNRSWWWLLFHAFSCCLPCSILCLRCHAFQFFSFSPFCFAIVFLLIRFSSNRRQKSRLCVSITRCLVTYDLRLEPWALSYCRGYRLGIARNGKVDKRKAPHRSLRPRSSRVGCEVHGASTASTKEAEVAASRGANFAFCLAKAAKA